MSQKHRIRPLPRKRLPYGKFRYSVEFWNSRDHYNKRRVSFAFDVRVSQLADSDFYENLHKTLETNVQGRYRVDYESMVFMHSIVERIWFENYSDLLIIKMLNPEYIRRMYRVELFD